MPTITSTIINIFLLNLIWILVIADGEASWDRQKVLGRRRRLSIFRRKDSTSDKMNTASFSNTTESPRTRKFSAEEHAKRFVQYEFPAAKSLIENLLHQTVEAGSQVPSRTERTRLEPIPNVISYHDGETIATIYTKGQTGNITRCTLFEIKQLEDSDRILAQFATDTKRPVQKISFRTMLTVITACQAIDPVSGDVASLKDAVASSSEVEHQQPRGPLSMRAVISGILPGTKWCGLGDIAHGYEDLGQDKSLDKCCRAHDHCPRKLRSFRSGYGLINWSLYTKSHCDCDSLLYECLKKAGGSTADLLGNFYFNVLRVQCIDEENNLKCLVRGRDNTCQTWGPPGENMMFFRDIRREF